MANQDDHYYNQGGVTSHSLKIMEEHENFCGKSDLISFFSPEKGPILSLQMRV
jgi:hypothetical protein